MKIFSFLLGTIFFVVSSFQKDGKLIGKRFPSLACETSKNVIVSFPEMTKGKYSLVGIAFSQDSQELLKSWMQPVFDQFLKKTNLEEDQLFDPSVHYDLNTYFIPMFVGINQAVSKSLKDKIIKVTSKEFLPYLLFYKGDNAFKEELDIDKKDSPYFYVLDKLGVIRYATSGKFDEKKMDDIIAVLDAGFN